MEAGRNADFPKLCLGMMADSEVPVWDWVAELEEQDFYKGERTLSGDGISPENSAQHY